MNKLFLILLLAFPVCAQDIIRPIKAEDRDPPVTSYDKFKDQTSVKVECYLKEHSFGPDALTLFASITYPGPRLKKPVDTFLFIFRVEAKDWQLLKSQRDLIMLIDGQRAVFNAAYYDNDVVRGGTNEYVSYAVTPLDMEDITKASKVELQIGAIESSLDLRTRLSLKDLLDAAKIK